MDWTIHIKVSRWPQGWGREEEKRLRGKYERGVVISLKPHGAARSTAHEAPLPEQKQAMPLHKSLSQATAVCLY